MALAEEKNATTLFNLGVIFEEQGNRLEASRAYQEVRECWFNT